MRLGLGSAAVAFTALALAAPAPATLPIGPQFRVSQTGPEGDASFDATTPAVAYNTRTNQYLVLWSGSAATAGEFEVWGRFIGASGSPLGGSVRISYVGPDGDPAYDAHAPAVAYNVRANQYLVVWSGSTATAGEFEAWGQLLDASGSPLGASFRVSDLGTDGTSTFRADDPKVAYNAQANEYLVIWYGDDNTAPLVDNEREIFGQRLTAAGAETGANDFRISDLGPNGSTAYQAAYPAVAYGVLANEYLVVWTGDDNAAPHVDNEDEIFGQRLSAAGAELGPNDFPISDMGPDGSVSFVAQDPAVTFNTRAGEYLVVWSGDDDTAPLVDSEYEIFGQRLAATGTEVGTNDFRISDMGPNGNSAYYASYPAVTSNTLSGEYLVVWNGEDDTAPLVDNEIEVFGQRLSASGTELDANDFRISQMGPDANASFRADDPVAAFATTPNEYLVAWAGNTNVAPLVDEEFEIWARRSGGPVCTLEGTPGNDVLVGTPGPDRVCALAGNDRVFGLGGDDRILLGPGRDRAFGGAGRDVILGGTGADRISGGKGRDRLFGQRGRDVLLARDRVRDLVHGGRGFDRARIDRRRDTRRSIERLF